jgi:septal ring factor EnvC (AmiA/AmiB activator)
MKKILLILSLSLITTCLLAQPSKQELQKKEVELRKEINELTNTLTQIQKNKKATVAQIASVQRKIAAREELVNNIYKQVRLLDETIYQNELEIYRMRKELDTLKIKYAQSIVFAYKNRSSYQYLNFLFSSSSFNDAIKRITYLKSYRKLRETQVGNIVKTQQVLQEKIGTLTNSKKEQTQVLAIHKNELDDLEKDKKEKDLVAKELKGREKEVAALINRKERQRREMNLAINAIIKREIAEAERSARLAKLKAEEEEKKRLAGLAATSKTANNVSTANTTGTNSANVSANDNVTTLANPNKTRDYTPFETTAEGLELSKKFEERNLPWPVSIGEVIVPFGTYNAGDKLVGQNDGIEIAVPEGTVVKSVADGVVSFVGDIGSELVVIVKHGKYFTSYSHLSSTSVTKGQTVKAGTALGKSGIGLEGEGALQFMIFNDKRTPLNPKSWLRGR